MSPPRKAHSRVSAGPGAVPRRGKGKGTPGARGSGRTSDLENELVTLISWAKLPPPEREWQFHPPRRFRFDLAYPNRMLAIEVEGGIYSDKSGHRSITGFVRDIEKYALALLDGWRVLRVTEREIRDGRALEWIETLLAGVVTHRSPSSSREEGAAYWKRKALDAQKVIADRDRYIASLEADLPKPDRAPLVAQLPDSN